MGIPGPKPVPVFGNFIQEIKSGLIKYHRKAHLDYKSQGHKVFGMHRGNLAILVLTDLDLIRDVCVKYFYNFSNRTTIELDGAFNNTLTQHKDDHWKRVRATISPAFNTSRLKRMYRHIHATADQLVEFVRGKQEAGEMVELKETCSQYTLDVIARSGFGIQINSFEDDNKEFHKQVKVIMTQGLAAFLIGFFLDFLTPVRKALGIKLFPKKANDAVDYLIGAVDMSAQHRKQEGKGADKRDDLLALMMEAETEGGEDDNMSKENQDFELDGIKIPKGTSVSFVPGAIHYDPDIWPDPEKFDPERFTAENKANRHPYAWMPFGQGPRNCIGMRLALLEMKVAVAAILQKFNLVRCEKTVFPVELVPMRGNAKDGLWVKFEPR